MEKDELEDEFDIKDEVDADDGEAMMDEESFDDGNKDNPEVQDIRELRTRLEMPG